MIHPPQQRTPFAIFLIMLTLLSFLADMTIVTAQVVLISGKVIDANTQTPLPYVTLRIVGSTFGTITNEEGVFQLEFPAHDLHDTLVVSRLGYHSYQTFIENHDAKQLTIRLHVKPIQLKEVTIMGENLSARDILDRAYRDIEKNYPVNAVDYSVFYRETQQENGKYVLLAEAALDIHDKGFLAPAELPLGLSETIYVKALRRSKNYRNTILKNTPFERWNLVISTLRCNPLKYNNYVKQMKAHAKDFAVDSITYIGDREVYVISFHTYIPRESKFERKNTLYIDTDDFVIYRYNWEEYPLAGKYSERPWSITKKSIYKSARKRISTTYEYERYGNKMFLKYFDERCYDDIYNADTNAVEFEALGHTTLVVNQIQSITERANEKPLNRFKSLCEQEIPFDESFWRKFSTPLPLTTKQIEDLEWEIPLDEQFQAYKP